RHGGDDIARALRPAIGHVLHDTDRADRVDFRFARGERMHEADHARGSRHIAFHVLHAGRGLDRNAAGIETDAFADAGARRGAARVAVPAHDDRAALVLGALADAEQRVHAELLHLLDAEYLDDGAEFFQTAGAAGEFFRVEHVGRFIDEIARNRHAV